MGNPASYYGHTLLKFNREDNQHSRLLDQTLNYGAILPQDPNPVLYIVNGVFGGYDGGFSSIEYYFHNHHYGETELRDIWEYSLSFSQPEVELITAHGWELLGKKFTYFFFKKNCAYRMAKLIEAATDVDLDPDNPFYSIPQSLVQKAVRYHHNGRALVKNISYHPSLQSRLYESYKSLSRGRKRTVRKLIENPDFRDSVEYKALPTPEKQDINSTLVDYYTFIAKKDRGSPEQIPYQQALAELFVLPPASADKENTMTGTPQSPDTSRPPSLLRVGRFNRDSTNGMTMTLRPAYYDSLDADAGQLKHAGLAMAEIEVEIIDENVSLTSLDFIAIEKINRYATFLPGDIGRSWRLKAGLERQDLACTGCLIARAQGDLGVAVPVTDNLAVGTSLGGALQEQRHKNGYGFIRASTFLNYQARRFSFNLNYESRFHPDSHKKHESVYGLAARYALGKNHEVRLEYQNNVADQVSLGFGIYF